MFRKKRLAFTLFALWTAGLGVYVAVTPALYEEEIQFLINNNRAPSVVSPEINNGPIARDYVDESIVATELQLLSNVDLLRDVVQKCSLAGNNPGAQEKAVKDLRKALKFSPVLKANMIKATYSSSDPHEVEAVLRTVSEDYLNEHVRAHGSAGTYELFGKQAEAYQEQLKSLQERLAAFHERRDIVTLAQQKDLGLQKLVDLEAALKETAGVRAANIQKIGKLKEQLAGLGSRITTQSRKMPNQYSVERLNTMLAELQNKRTELLVKYQPTERLVQEIDQQIADTKASLQNAGRMMSTEETTDVNPIRQSLETELAKSEVAEIENRARIASLERDIAGYRRSLSGLQNATADDDQLLREIKEAEDSFFLYSKKREEARIAEAMDRQKIANVVLVQSPRLPALPMPKLSLTLLATYILGVLLILLIALALGVASRQVFSPWEIETLTGLPVLAEVPYQVPGPITRALLPGAIAESHS
jgi:uncharacterized protein involved in exopolysaccharide biosynthesis